MKLKNSILFRICLPIVALIIALSFLVAFAFLINKTDYFLFLQLIILGIFYLVVFPNIMILLVNCYFKIKGKKIWEKWFKIPLDFDYVLTVIAIIPWAFIMLELLIFSNSYHLPGSIDSLIILVLLIPVFIYSNKIITKLFGYEAEIDTSQFNYEKQIDPNDFTIRQPNSSLVIYIIITIMFMGIFAVIIWSVIENNKGLDGFFAVLLFSPLALLGPFFIVIWSRWKIIIKDRQITYTSYFKKAKSFTFDDITRVKHRVGHTRIGTIHSIAAFQEKKKLFSLGDICPGYRALITRLEGEGVNIEW
jgi:hypothetical protein